MPEERKHQFATWYIFAAFLGVMLIQFLWLRFTQIETIPYSQFEQLLAENKISEVLVGTEAIQGTLKEPFPDGRKLFYTVRVDPELADKLKEHGVTITGAPSSSFLSTILSWVLPIFIFYLIWTYGIRHMAERQGSRRHDELSENRAPRSMSRRRPGLLLRILPASRKPKPSSRRSWISSKNPENITAGSGPASPRVYCSWGRLAPVRRCWRAPWRARPACLFSISGSEFVEMFVGVGAARVRDLFEQARKAKPCIIFIDELDSLGRVRSLAASAAMTRRTTLDQLLAELDGFDPSVGIVLLAATNRPEILDAALTRAGRFDRQVALDRPEKAGRAAILKVHMRKISLAADLDIDQIAAITPGFSGADIANLVNEAALTATRRHGGPDHGRLHAGRGTSRAGIEKKSSRP